MAEQAKKLPKDYQTNPFTIAITGITLLFDLARGIGFLFVAFAVLGLFGPDTGARGDIKANEAAVNEIANTVMAWGFNEWLIAIGATSIILLAFAMIGALLGGVSAYTSSRLAKGQQVSIGEAFRESFDHLWSFLWLQIIVGVKTFLWALLFIIPGIIMAVRYSLSGVAYYDDKKNLRGNAAVKESLRLTKGAWLTTYSSNTLFNLITFGMISSIITTGVNAVLYRQYDKLGDKKPDAHWLSWFTLFLPFILAFMFLAFILLVIVVIGATGQSLK